jgi:putative transposase
MMNQFEYQEFYCRNLPHIQPPEATLFVTFRLDGSIPEPVLEKWRMEKRLLKAMFLKWEATTQPGTIPDPDNVAEEKLKFHRRWFQKFEDVLHAGKTGPLWLRNPDIAEIVSESLRYRDGKVFRLDAFCIMPNHVHAVFAPFLTEELAIKLAERRIRLKKGLDIDALDDDGVEYVLASIMQSLKRHTARKCNLALKREGQFWQHESFDHFVRNQSEFEKTISYVLNNPVKAGLVDDPLRWQWSYRRPYRKPAVCEASREG